MKPRITPLDLLMLAICCISYVAIGLLCAQQFHAIFAVIFGITITGLGLILTGHYSIQWPKLRTILMIAGLLLFALLFRSSPYLYIMGAEDQGVYVNMGAYYHHHHSTFVTDEVRKAISSPVLQSYYDKNNQLHGFVSDTQGNHIPGLYFHNLGDNQYVFQFYPLHPLWLAISAYFLGDAHSVDSMIFFSLLSVLFFALLAFELSQQNLACAVFAGVLLALNPLHVFFSKFPTAEIVEQAFWLASLYYLVRYQRAYQRYQQSNTFFLVLSALAIGCAFFTHLDCFILIPWYVFFLVLALIFTASSQHRTSLIIYFISVILLYALSIVYGLFWSYPYTHDVFLGILRVFIINFGVHWLSILIACGLALGIGLIIAARSNHTHWAQQLAHKLPLLNQMLTGLIIIIFIVASIRILQIAFSTSLLNSSVAHQFHRHFPLMMNHGILSFRFSSLVITAVYLSPLAVIIYFYALFRYPTFDTHGPQPHIFRCGMLTLMAIAWCYVGIFNFLVPYQYFYLRFILSFALPLTLLLISLKLGEMFVSESKSAAIDHVITTMARMTKHKRTALLIFLFLAGYSLIMTSAQLGKQEAAGAYASSQKISQHLGNNDLLFVTAFNDHYFEIITPIQYFPGLNIFVIHDSADLRKLLFEYHQDFSHYQHLYLLSSTMLNPNNTLFAPIDYIPYNFSWFRPTTKLPPRDFETIHHGFYLYRINNKLSLS